MVQAHLAEQLFLILEDTGSNPVTATFIEHLFIVNCVEKMKIKKKRPGMGLFCKKH